MPIAGLGAFLFFTPAAPSVPVLVDAQTQAPYKRPATIQLPDAGMPVNIAPPALVSFAPDAPPQQGARPVKAQADIPVVTPSASAAGWDHTPQTAQPPAKPIVKQQPIDAIPPLDFPADSGWVIESISVQRPAKPIAIQRPVEVYPPINIAFASGWVPPPQFPAKPIAVQRPFEGLPPSIGVWNFTQDIWQPPAKPIVKQQPYELTPPVFVTYASGWIPPPQFPAKPIVVQRPDEEPPPINIPYASGWVAEVAPRPWRGSVQLPTDAFPTSTVAAITAWEDSTRQRPAKPIVIQLPVDATPPINIPYASGWVPPPQAPAKPIVGQRPIDAIPSLSTWGWVPPPQAAAKPLVIQRPYELTPPIDIAFASGWEPPPQAPAKPIAAQRPFEGLPPSTLAWGFIPATAQAPAKPIVIQRPYELTPPINIPYASGWTSELQPRPRTYRIPVTVDAFPTSTVVVLTAWAEPVRQYGAKPIFAQPWIDAIPPRVVRVGGFEPPPQASPAPYPGRTRLAGTEPAPGVPAAIVRRVGGYDPEPPVRRARRTPLAYPETVTGIGPFGWAESPQPRMPQVARVQVQGDAIVGPAPVAGFDGIVLFGRAAITSRLQVGDVPVGPRPFAGFEGLAPAAVRAFVQRQQRAFDGLVFGAAAAALDIPGQAILLDGTTQKILLLDGASSGVVLLDDTTQKIVMYDTATGSVVVTDALAWLAALEDKD